MKKLLAILLNVVLVMSLVVGCGNKESEDVANEDAAVETGEVDEGYVYGSDPNVEGHIVIWSWAEDAHLQTMALLNEKYPNITTEWVGVEQAEYLSKLQMTASSGGELPDIIIADGSWRGTVFDMGIVDDLSQAPYNCDTDLIADFSKTFSYNSAGELVGIQGVAAPSGLAYRTDYAEKWLGTSDPAEIQAMLTDWDAFIEVGKEVSAKSNNEVKMLSGPSAIYGMISKQNSEPHTLEDGTLNLDASIGRAIDYSVKMQDAGIMDVLDGWTPSWCNAVGDGSVLFWPMPVWGVHHIIEAQDPEGAEEGLWRMVQIPEGSVSDGGATNSVWKDSKNKEAAYLYVMLSVTEEYGEFQAENSWFAVGDGLYEDPESDLYNMTSQATGDLDLTEFYMRNAVNTITDRICTSVDANVEQAVTAGLNVVKENEASADEVMEIIEDELLTLDSSLKK